MSNFGIDLSLTMIVPILNKAGAASILLVLHILTSFDNLLKNAITV